MKSALIVFIAGVILAWASAIPTPGASAQPMSWLVHQQALYLSGLLAIALMSLVMALATRPAWLERPLGGMDRAYRLHRWAGIGAVLLAVVHWLLSSADELGEDEGEHEDGAAEPALAGLVEALREAAAELGEVALIALVALVALTLWKGFAYKLWRHVHRLMPVLYLMLVPHAALLAPAHYWLQPVGLMLACMLTAGAAAALLSLAGRIGRNRQTRATVLSVAKPAPGLTELVCQLDKPWPAHRAGQFALLRFARLEGAHPFTIASAPRADGRLRFEVKALGDYTRGLDRRVVPGQAVTIEGPYGRFVLERHDRKARQIWVAAGIGITPFIAWLERLHAGGLAPVVADLHVFARDPEHDPLLARVRELCAALPDVALQVHTSGRGEALPIEHIVPVQAGAVQRTELWFCGPRALAGRIRQALHHRRGRRVRWHQEAFEWR